MVLETNRLILRQWRKEDYSVYAKLTSDPEVMRYFPSPLSEEQSFKQADTLKSKIAKKGWGFWAVELKESKEFIGFIGLNTVDADSGIPHAPMIEVGWRLLATHWGKGYATEGAKRAIQYAFEELEATEIYSFTALVNKPSQRVMIKSGMQNIGEDFDHPKLTPGDELARHCLYRINREEWVHRTAAE
ncbi:GNAT family N-acetyltransferase [Mixta theicola]|uniref:GNAT family N-acetyltransferase n=1 Tax=Mixta theicola TaxID=1458355 RepID=A0A2K1Q662_9GAMM|nr:GNAT family N-acetyltransferase [Mixta theicola]PNS10515.1 GNAT family N-acetyltransferase [Mixta theicola]GLR08228.1 N-acetyltransferase [Mixta theicola]